MAKKPLNPLADDLGRVARTLLERDVSRIDKAVEYKGRPFTLTGYKVSHIAGPLIRIDIKEG